MRTACGAGGRPRLGGTLPGLSCLSYGNPPRCRSFTGCRPVSAPLPRVALRRDISVLLPVLGIAAGLAACSDDGLSTDEARDAARQRLAQELRLSPDATLLSEVFVGREREGERVLCGRVGGTRADGSRVGARRFIIALDESQWLAFEPTGAATQLTPVDMFPQWAELCAGAEGETGVEPLAPTERGES